MPFVPFVLGSIVGRGGRFYLVAGLMAWGGARLEKVLLRYINWIGWALVILIILLIIAYKLNQ